MFLPWIVNPEVSWRSSELFSRSLSYLYFAGYNGVGSLSSTVGNNGLNNFLFNNNSTVGSFSSSLALVAASNNCHRSSYSE